MNNEQSSDVAPWVRFVSLALGLLLLGVLLLSPVRAWLNQIPNFWQIVYPLLTLFTGYLVVSGLRAKEGVLTTAKWIVLFASALCATIYALGAGRIFFTVARWAAILFIVAEVLLTVFEELIEGDDVPTV
jgi:uncharacterized SAM-binding protein YcdF (DUF218 family)